MIKPEAKIMTFDEFSASRGVESFAPQYPEYHNPSANVSKPASKAAQKRLTQKLAEWQEKRDALRLVYRHLVDMHLIIPPSRKDRLIAIAKGTGEQAAAAQRILKRRYKLTIIY